MEIPADLVASAASHLTRKADLPDYTGAFALAALQRWVAQHLHTLLANGKHEALVQICYRVDIDEAALQAAFDLRERDEIAAELAKLLVARELQKAESRARYKDNP